MLFFYDCLARFPEMEKERLFIPLIIFGIALLAMLIVAFSHLLLPGYFEFDAKRIIELILFALVASWIIVNRHQQENILALFFCLPKLARWSLAAFFIIGILSALLAISSRHGFLEMGLHILLLMMIFYVATIRQHYIEAFDVGLIFTIMITLFIYSCTSLHGYFHCNS